jgi:hypothetical protein
MKEAEQRGNRLRVWPSPLEGKWFEKARKEGKGVHSGIERVNRFQ